MKAKFLIVVLAALVLATGTVWAQKGHHNRRAEHKELTTEQVAKKMTDRMKENLSLSDEQVKQVYPICLEQAQAMREHRAERREMAEKSREAMAQQREQMAGRMYSTSCVGLALTAKVRMSKPPCVRVADQVAKSACTAI